MEPYKKRLHLDKTEVLFLLGLVFLVSSLMFCFGMLLGFGLKNGNAPVEQAEHKGEHSDAHGSHGQGRSPASTDGTPGSQSETKKTKAEKIDNSPGARLRQDFKESKQRSLVEMNLRNTDAVQPKSLVDAKAHFAAHTDWNRNPGLEKDKEAFSNQTSETAANDRKVAGEEDETAREVPQGVKGLFERKPTSEDVFSPPPGTFTVQIASYATADESSAKIIDLRKKNFNEAYVQTVKLKNGETWYRVSVGAFPTSAWARKTGEKLVKQKLASDFVIRQVNND